MPRLKPGAFLHCFYQIEPAGMPEAANSYQKLPNLHSV